MEDEIRPVELTILVDNQAAQGLQAEHGYSVLVDDGASRLLFDTGQGMALKSNARALGVDIATVEKLALSHGHYDHSGGVAHVVEEVAALDVYLHPAAYSERFSIREWTAKRIGMSPETRACLASERVRLHELTEPVQLTGRMGITGPVPRFTDFEDTGGPFYLDDAGRDRDPIADDLALWMSTAEGLVVVVGCSHAGLLNTLHYVVRLSGQRDIHAVIGGFHLSSASNERIDRTVEELWEIRVGLVVPCHCTGEQATERLARRFGARCVPGRAGQKYRFGGQTGRLSL